MGKIKNYILKNLAQGDRAMLCDALSISLVTLRRIIENADSKKLTEFQVEKRNEMVALLKNREEQRKIEV